jgi:hypothetical protein
VTIGRSDDPLSAVDEQVITYLVDLAEADFTASGRSSTWCSPSEVPDQHRAVPGGARLGSFFIPLAPLTCGVGGRCPEILARTGTLRP